MPDPTPDPTPEAAAGDGSGAGPEADPHADPPADPPTDPPADAPADPVARAAGALLRSNFAARPGERLLFVSDGRKPAFAAALAAACAEAGLPFRHDALEREADFEPPAAVAAALREHELALLATARSYTR